MTSRENLFRRNEVMNFVGLNDYQISAPYWIWKSYVVLDQRAGKEDVEDLILYTSPSNL